MGAEDPGRSGSDDRKPRGVANAGPWRGSPSARSDPHAVAGWSGAPALGTKQGGVEAPLSR